MDYKDYNAQYTNDHSCGQGTCFTSYSFPYFMWSFTEIRYDQQHAAQPRTAPEGDLNKLQGMSWSFKRKSNPENVVIANMNLIDGVFKWRILSEYTNKNRMTTDAQWGDAHLSKCV